MFTAAQALQLFRTNAITVEAYAQALLARIKARDSTVKAWAYLDRVPFRHITMPHAQETEQTLIKISLQTPTISSNKPAPSTESPMTAEVPYMVWRLGSRIS